MIRKNFVVALFAIAALACLALPSFAETPPLEIKTCSASALSDTAIPPAPHFLTGQTCSSICSVPDCLGAIEGTPCTKPFSGAPGICTITGRVCSPGNKQCGCW
jgi:hypothetical protein